MVRKTLGWIAMIPSFAIMLTDFHFLCASRALQLASLGSKPQILLSSGSRTVENGDDVGVMALRTPGDIRNVMEVVMKFQSRQSFEAMHTVGRCVLQQAHERRFGKRSVTVTEMAVMETGVEEEKAEPKQVKQDETVLSTGTKRKEPTKEIEGDGDTDGQDGFIAF